MQFKVDLIQGEILYKLPSGEINPEYPLGGLCKSGHKAPLGTRFFHVHGPVLPLQHHGFYCEPCLKIANRLSNGEKLDVEKELEILLIQEEKKLGKAKNAG